LTLTFNNPNAFALTQADFIETLPASLQASAGGATTCSGVSASVQASGTSVAVTGLIIPAKGSCTVTLPVSSSTTGTYTNTIPANALTTGPAGGNTATATASLNVTAPTAPTVAVAFSPSSVNTNTKSTLTITLANSNGYALTQANLADALPTGITVATTPAAATTCAGSLTAGSGTETLAGATIPANGSCNVTLTVSSSAAGSYTNTVAANSLTTAQNASNSASAAGTLTVAAPSHGGGALDWLDLAFVAGALGFSVSQRRNRRVTIST
jgi:hypothetical protein